MNDIEGKINIDVFPNKINGSEVEIKSSRPVQASKVMHGKTPDQALHLLPLMYNVCGVAQARTSLKAIQNSQAIQADPNAETARDMLVLVENAREHLFRILVDWPKLFDLQPNKTALPLLGHLIKDFKQSLFVDGDAFSLNSQLQPDPEALNRLIQQLEDTLQQAVYHTPTQQWLQINDIDSLYDWSQDATGPATNSLAFICDHGWSSQGFSDLDPLPELETTQLISQFNASNADDFIALPKWNGKHYETTTLSRQMNQPLIKSLASEFHNTLVTRWVARLLELAHIPQQLHELASQLNSSQPLINHQSEDGMGLAQTEAARGRLIHRVQINDGKISQYQILAPTEWNFHPQGLIAQSLGNLSSRDPEQLKQLAQLMINAIDPCVGYDLRIH